MEKDDQDLDKAAAQPGGETEMDEDALDQVNGGVMGAFLFAARLQAQAKAQGDILKSQADVLKATGDALSKAAGKA